MRSKTRAQARGPLARVNDDGDGAGPCRAKRLETPELWGTGSRSPDVGGWRARMRVIPWRLAMLILVLNCGSSSLKYQVVNPETGQVQAKETIDRLGGEGSHAAAIRQAIEAVSHLDIGAVGHRVVHGGAHFHDATLIDRETLEAIERCARFAPLHNPHNIAGIRTAMASLGSVPHVAVFDTAFHARMPRRARTYAIDREVSEALGIRRFGFHGTSHAYVTGLAAEFLKRPLDELCLVSLHLGNGASACAVEFGHSTDTSMGMTPLEGLVMGTRSGDLDPGIVLTLMRERNLDADELDDFLNRSSGLAGLTGTSGDMRDIEERAARGDDHARLAISVFVHRARKYIGAYAAAMGRIDGVVLTGGIGENSVSIRRRILQRLDFLGIVLDEDQNHAVSLSDATPVARVSSEVSRVPALVVRTNEGLMIARQTEAIALRKATVRSQQPIPIAISARHIHLDAETFAKLFGKGASPTHYRDISQPGQYACEERVNLIGPRSRIDGVRLLGPLRGKNQVEISRTDEFALGVDAPIRDSGNVGGSARITVEGPKGTVVLEEGLICARRHIHMAPEDAEAYGVRDKDEVEVEITGGPRDLTFGDVLVRVSPKYKLEMHIDTDEANAAELSPTAQGTLVYEPVQIASATLRSRRIH